MAKKTLEKPKTPTVQALIELVQRKYSDALVIPLGDAFDYPIGSISTGSLEWDWMLRAGGIPPGYYTELAGRQGIGKTTVAQGIAIELSKSGMTTLYMEPEHKLAPTYFLECATANGGDWTKITHIKPPTGKAALDIVLAAIGIFSLIVIDSMPALVTTQEIDGATEDVFWAANAKMVAQFIKQATAKLGLSGRSESLPVQTAIVGINQLRANMDAGLFGPKSKPAGGWAWRHAQGVQINLTGGKLILDTQKESIGILINAGLGKSVVGKPRETAESWLRFGDGIYQARDVLTMGLKMGLIELKGAFYYLVGEDKCFAKGEVRAVQYLDERSQLRAELRGIMRERVVERAKSEAPFKAIARILPILAECGRIEALFKFLRWNVASGGKPVNVSPRNKEGRQ